MNALVLQCGGPTAVVNTSLAALARRWRALFEGACLYGGRYGLAALTTGEWIPLSSASGSIPIGHPERGAGADTSEWLARVEQQPGMALGGGRDRLSSEHLDAAVASLEARDVRTLFLIGGNGTMAAGRALAARAAARRSLRVVGIPKTIDNDIPWTDVCPGFPSAARFLIEAVRDIAADVACMRGYEDVVLVEAMGRHTGWLSAATLLARSRPQEAPHLVLVPERPVVDDLFLEAVRQHHARSGTCVVTVAEGVRNANGALLAEWCAGADVERDASGQTILGRSGGPLPYLASLVRSRLRLRCRLVRPDVLQRCSRAHVTAFDRAIAAAAGAAAVDAAAAGAGPDAVMVALRVGPAGWRTGIVPLEQVRGERTLPGDIEQDTEQLQRLLG